MSFLEPFYGLINVQQDISMSPEAVVQAAIHFALFWSKWKMLQIDIYQLCFIKSWKLIFWIVEKITILSEVLKNEMYLSRQKMTINQLCILECLSLKHPKMTKPSAVVSNALWLLHCSEVCRIWLSPNNWIPWSKTKHPDNGIICHFDIFHF